jgi:hypothetical protein
MSVYPCILDQQSCLTNSGVRTIVPDPEDDVAEELGPREFDEFKRRVAFAYLRKIRDPRTIAVLAVNCDNHGIANYIGPNTFAEIAVAFAQGKRIYVFQQIPAVYEDELVAWGAVPLGGDLSRLVDDFNARCREAEQQLLLFD